MPTACGATKPHFAQTTSITGTDGPPKAPATRISDWTFQLAKPSIIANARVSQRGQALVAPALSSAAVMRSLRSTVHLVSVVITHTYISRTLRHKLWDR